MQIKYYPITKNFHWITFLPNPTTPALEKYYQPYGSTEPARSPRGATAMIVIQCKIKILLIMSYPCDDRAQRCH